MRLSQAVLALGLAVTAQAAAAADRGVTNLKGIWTGVSESIFTGPAPHHGSAPGNEPMLANTAFTFDFTGQDGRRFWGTVTSKRHSERFLGVIGFDGKTFIAQDPDGLLQGTLVNANTIDLIYSHTGTSTVVTAIKIRRQR